GLGLPGAGGAAGRARAGGADRLDRDGAVGVTIAVTGATGGIGSRVAKRLRARGADQRLVVRDLARVPAVGGLEAVAMGPRGYRDQPALTEALGGCDTLLLVSAHESEERVVEHAHAVRAAVDAGVRR